MQRPARGDYRPSDLGARCDICPIAKRKIPVVPVPPYIPSGKPKLVIVGEAPGYYESVKGEPFVGKSGFLLNATLGKSRFLRTEAYITNTIACRLENEKAERDAATACCAPRLARELAEIPAEIPILTLGASAAKPFINRGAIQRARGFIWRVAEVEEHTLHEVEKSRKVRAQRYRAKRDDKALDLLRKAQHRELLTNFRASIPNRVVIPSIHPAFILRGADMQLPVMQVDFDRAIRWARNIADGGLGLDLEDEGSYEVVRNPKQLKAALKSLRKHVSIDIETNAADALYSRLTCVGLSDDFDGKGKTIVISPEKLKAGWVKPFTPILKDFYKKHVAVTHNGPNFDEIRLKRVGIPLPHLDDTLLAYHSFCAHNLKGLDHVTSIYCDSGPWKIYSKAKSKGAAEKGGFYSKPTEDLSIYCAADVRLDIRDWHRMQEDLNTERHIYEFDMEVARKICQQMQVVGLRVDQEKRKFLSDKLGARSRALLGEMRRILGRPNFNPGSLDDLRRALFKQCRVPLGLAELTPTGLPSTGKLVLEALRMEDTRAGKLADLVLRRRSALDSKAEYLDNLPVGADGRVHATWKIYGTRGGRPATGNPNVLNMPRYNKDPEAYEEHIRSIWIPAPGKIFVYYDLAQSEPKFAAYISGDPNFIEDCKKDVHTVRAAILFPRAADVILADPKGKGAWFRQITKTCGLAVTYKAAAATVHATVMRDDKIKEKPSISECTALVEKLGQRYTGWMSWVAGLVALSKKQGFVRTPFEKRLVRCGFYAEESFLANLGPQSGVAEIMGRRLLEMERRKPRGAHLVFYGYDSACYELVENQAPLMMRLCKELWEEPIRVPHNGLEFVQNIDMKEPAGRLSAF